MNEVYWITRLDYLHNFVEALLVISCVSVGVAVLVLLMGGDDSDIRKGVLKVFKWTIPFSIFIGLIYCFVPTTKEALLIYGVGGSIDYIQNHKDIPAKVEEAAIKWLESIDK